MICRQPGGVRCCHTRRVANRTETAPEEPKANVQFGMMANVRSEAPPIPAYAQGNRRPVSLAGLDPELQVACSLGTLWGSLIEEILWETEMSHMCASWRPMSQQEFGA